MWSEMAAPEPCSPPDRLLGAPIPVQMAWQHIPDEDLERHYLGKATERVGTRTLEEYLLACLLWVERAEESQDRVPAANRIENASASFAKVR